MKTTITNATAVEIPGFHLEYRVNEDGSLDVFVFRASERGYYLPAGFMLGYSSLHYEPK